MLYDPLAVKRLASAVCVLPPTPRSRIGTSGCQGCESSSTTESSRELGLDAGALGRLYCVLSQEEEQQRPVVGHGIVLGACPSQENLAKGKGRALGAERSSTEPFRKKDQATYIGAQRHLGGVGGCAHQQPGTRPPSTSGTSQRRSPAGGVPVTPLGSHHTDRSVKRSAKPLGEGGERCVRRICYRAWHKRWCRGVHMTGQRGEGSGAGSAETG